MRRGGSGGTWLVQGVQHTSGSSRLLVKASLSSPADAKVSAVAAWGGIGGRVGSDLEGRRAARGGGGGGWTQSHNAHCTPRTRAWCSLDGTRPAQASARLFEAPLHSPLARARAQALAGPPSAANASRRNNHSQPRALSWFGARQRAACCAAARKAGHIMPLAETCPSLCLSLAVWVLKTCPWSVSRGQVIQ